MPTISFESIEWNGSTLEVKKAVSCIKWRALQAHATLWQMPYPDPKTINDAPNGWPYMSEDQQMAFVLTHGQYQASQQSATATGNGVVPDVADIVDFVFDIPSMSCLYCIKVGTLRSCQRTRAEVHVSPYSAYAHISRPSGTPPSLTLH